MSEGPNISIIIGCLALLLYWILTVLVLPSWARKSPVKPPSLRTKYLNSIHAYFVYAFFAFFIASVNKIPVFGEIRLNLKIFLLAFGFLALTMLLDSVGWKFTSAKIKRKQLAYLPHTAQEKWIWIAVTLVIAVGEEIIYRAAFLGLFYRLTGNYWVAAVISAVLFAIIHKYWGWTAVGSTFFVGLGLQYLVLISGGLYAAIAVHFAHNFLNGIIYGTLTKSEDVISENVVADSAEINVEQILS